MLSLRNHFSQTLQCVRRPCLVWRIYISNDLCCNCNNFYEQKELNHEIQIDFSENLIERTALEKNAFYMIAPNSASDTRNVWSWAKILLFTLLVSIYRINCRHWAFRHQYKLISLIAKEENKIRNDKREKIKSSNEKKKIESKSY